MCTTSKHADSTHALRTHVFPNTCSWSIYKQSSTPSHAPHTGISADSPEVSYSSIIRDSSPLKHLESPTQSILYLRSSLDPTSITTPKETSGSTCPYPRYDHQQTTPACCKHPTPLHSAAANAWPPSQSRLTRRQTSVFSQRDVSPAIGRSCRNGVTVQLAQGSRGLDRSCVEGTRRRVLFPRRDWGCGVLRAKARRGCGGAGQRVERSWISFESASVLVFCGEGEP